MFDAIAFRYDALNHLLSMGVDRSWRRKVVRRVHAAKPATILDLATGTGDLAIMLARKCPQSAVTGIDLSSRSGARKSRRPGWNSALHSCREMPKTCRRKTIRSMP